MNKDNKNGSFGEAENTVDEISFDDVVEDVGDKAEKSTSKNNDEAVYTNFQLKESVISSTQEEVVDPSAEKNEKSGKKKIYDAVYDFVSTGMMAIIIITVLFTFVFRPVTVDGESMTNTLQEFDCLLTVNKAEYKQGDIVVITQDTYFHEPLIKRIIAKGGQTVDIDFDTGTVYVDGVALKEPYVKENFIYPKFDDCEFPYKVPEGHLFCMGDNRNGSTDSRSHLVGPIDERAILGKAVVRILPFGDFDIYDYE